jgi:hypothetical protein
MSWIRLLKDIFLLHRARTKPSQKWKEKYQPPTWISNAMEQVAFQCHNKQDQSKILGFVLLQLYWVYKWSTIHSKAVTKERALDVYYKENCYNHLILTELQINQSFGPNFSCRYIYIIQETRIASQNVIPFLLSPVCFCSPCIHEAWRW